MNLPYEPHRQRPELPGSANPRVPESELSNAARSEACVLLTGPPAAVQALARRIHGLSRARNGRFTAVDCASLPVPLERLLQRGSNDGWAPGPGEAGTLLLQDIGSLDFRKQAWLADWLTGAGDDPGRVTRVMASSAEPLFPRVLAGTFDDRLFYRLNVLQFIVTEAAGAGRMQ